MSREHDRTLAALSEMQSALNKALGIGDVNISSLLTNSVYDEDAITFEYPEHHVREGHYKNLNSEKVLHDLGHNFHFGGGIMMLSLLLHREKVPKDEDSNLIFEVDMKMLPGCCAVGIVTAAHTFSPFQRKGVAREVLKFIEVFAHHTLGYSQLLATDREHGYGSAVLNTAGWSKLTTKVNLRTGNPVTLYSRYLP